MPAQSARGEIFGGRGSAAVFPKDSVAGRPAAPLDFSLVPRDFASLFIMFAPVRLVCRCLRFSFFFFSVLYFSCCEGFHLAGGGRRTFFFLGEVRSLGVCCNEGEMCVWLVSMFHSMK